MLLSVCTVSRPIFFRIKEIILRIVFRLLSLKCVSWVVYPYLAIKCKESDCTRLHLSTLPIENWWLPTHLIIVSKIVGFAKSLKSPTRKIPWHKLLLLCSGFLNDGELEKETTLCAGNDTGHMPQEAMHWSKIKKTCFLSPGTSILFSQSKLQNFSRLQIILVYRLCFESQMQQNIIRFLFQESDFYPQLPCVWSIWFRTNFFLSHSLIIFLLIWLPTSSMIHGKMIF